MTFSFVGLHPRPKNIFAKTGKIQRDGSWLGLIWKWKTVLKQLSLFFHFRRSPLLFKASWQFRMEMVIAIVKFVKRIQVTSHFLFNLKNWKGLYSKRTKSFLLTKRKTRFINRKLKRSRQLSNKLSNIYQESIFGLANLAFFLLMYHWLIWLLKRKYPFRSPSSITASFVLCSHLA